MGKLLVIKGADFSTNGTPIVDHDAEKLNKIKQVLEENFYELSRYGSPYATNAPSLTSNNRSAFGGINASQIDFVPFVITPKTGCKIAAIQNDANNTQTKRNLSWSTEPVTFDQFTTYPIIGGNLAYSSDGAISANTPIWEFIDVALAE